MDYRILGPLELRGRNGPLPLDGRRERLLVALLVVSANRLVSTDELIDGLWGASPPRTASTALQGAVSRVRRAFAADQGPVGRERLVTESGGYRLIVDAEELDATRFERLVEEGRAALADGRAEAAAQRLGAALALWRGDPLADLRYEAAVQDAIARLEEARLGAMEARVEAELALGRHAALVGELDTLVRRHPFRERFRAQLVRALYGAGRQADALDAYRAARTALVEELGLEPGPELRDLHTRILRQDPALAPRPRSNLPSPATRLIGRHTTLVRLAELIRSPDTRLLTLTGVGGSGKSRLTLELAHRVLGEFHDGALFVPLAPIGDASLVLPTIAATVGASERPHEDLVETIARALDGKELLLILDNFEHVLPAARDIAALVERTSGPTTVVTSRAALRVAAERRFEVPPLEVPSVTRASGEALLDNEAVALFVERAGAVNPGFVATDRNASTIAAICVRLDGLPLALELAAARADVLSPLALLSRLDDRLELLSAGPHDRPARQQTLRATLDWSHDLLDDRERRVFRRLAVFAGGVDLAAIEAVCAAQGAPPTEILDAIAALVEKSVVRRWDDDQSEPRFGMLETIHEYAREKLRASGDEHDARVAHAEHFLHVAEAAYERRLDEETLLAARLQHDHDNFRAALDWLRERDARRFARLTGALAWFWNARAHLREGGARLSEALAVGDAAPRDRARVLVGAALVETWRADYDGAVAHLEKARALWSALRDHLESALALDALAYTWTMRGDRDRARATAAESLEAARRLGRPDRADRARAMLALTHVLDGDADGAEPLARAALAGAEARGDSRRAMEAHHLLGDCGLIRGDCERARRHYAAAARQAWEVGDLAQVTVDLEGVAMAVAGAGDPEWGVRLAAAAVRAASELGVDMDTVGFWTAFRARYLEPARERLGPAAETLAAEGRALSLERALDAAAAGPIP